MIEVRPMRVEDLEEVERIQADSPEAAHWTASDYLAHQSYVGVKDGRVLGFIVVQTLGAGEAELLNIAVAPAGRRRGVGRMLLKRIMELPVDAIHLEVRASNTAAQGFYISSGFRVTGCRREYYTSSLSAATGREDAVVMKYEKW